MKKKILSALLCGIMATAAVSAGAVTASAEEGVSLNVTTTFAGTESNVELYQETIQNWERKQEIRWRIPPVRQMKPLKPV